MSAYDFEYEHAKHDGAQFIFPRRAGRDCRDQRPRSPASSSCAPRLVGDKVEPIPGTEFCRTVRSRTQGRRPRKSRSSCFVNFFPSSASMTGASSPTNKLTGQTNVPHLFTGGDLRQRWPRGRQRRRRGQEGRPRHPTAFLTKQNRRTTGAAPRASAPSRAPPASGPAVTHPRPTSSRAAMKSK